MEKIKIKQVRSRIRCPKDQKAALDVLGLRKMHRVVELDANSAVLGNVRKVRHLIEIIEK